MVLERISTGISGIDNLIEGGIPRGFTVLVAGNPGTGKTILTSNFLMAGLKAGESGVYVSFSESKEQFYNNMERLGLDIKKYEDGTKFTFIDFASVTKEGVQDALDEILAVIKEMQAKRLVVDSFSAIAQSFDNQNEARIALQVILGKITRAEGVTNMLIAEVPIGSNTVGSGIEEFVVDGIIKLEHGISNSIPMTLKIVKMRGTSIDREAHVLSISSNGMTVFPKQPLMLSAPASDIRISSGVPGLDERMEGGFLEGTAIAVIGASGVGKTTLSFQFVAEGVKRGEPGLFCSLEESPDEIRRMAERYGYDVKELERKGLKIISKVAEDQSPDAFMAILKEEINRIRPKRLALDSLSAFEHGYKDDMYPITKRLVSLMREYNITAMLTILVSQQSGINLTDVGISSLFQGIILLRYVEVEGKMKRSMMLLKMRATSHDESILEFSISNGYGLKMVGAMDSYVGILTGVAHRIQKDYDEKEYRITSRQEAEKNNRRQAYEAAEREIAEQQEKQKGTRRTEYEKEMQDAKNKDE
ncbi:MAG TPA: ATPase domain-containing protein [Nitrososphaera sp.]|nr:ATPase domain-containing protein [Nitrososphaera sp.]